MRVVAGTARGRPLRAPVGRRTRPTSDRVREAIFDMLTSMGPLKGLAVADVFAGTGALGIEALSRGASSATFVDVERDAIDAVRANLDSLPELAGAAEVVRADALVWAAAAPRFDLVLADPPYTWDAWAALLEHLTGRAGLVVAESGAEIDAGGGWETLRARRYGSTVVSVLRPRPRGGE